MDKFVKNHKPVTTRNDLRDGGFCASPFCAGAINLLLFPVMLKINLVTKAGVYDSGSQQQFEQDL
jgi:hypothetical protein